MDARQMKVIALMKMNAMELDVDGKVTTAANRLQQLQVHH